MALLRSGGAVRLALAAVLSGAAVFGAALSGAALFATAAAQTGEPDYVGTFRDWHVFTYRDGGDQVCYIVTEPTQARGDYTNRGPIFLMVTNRPAAAEEDVVSIITGYTYAPESEVDATIGNREFQMFTQDDTAWNYTTAEDRQMVDAMISGTTLVAVGTSSRGTETTDTYSLLGFTAARNQMIETCQ
jgi:hypothetical protein